MKTLLVLMCVALVLTVAVSGCTLPGGSDTTIVSADQARDEIQDVSKDVSDVSEILSGIDEKLGGGG